MRKSDIDLENESYDVRAVVDDLMSAGMASVFDLETLSRMSGQDLETIKLINRVYKQAKEYALHQAKKIDEIDHKICELYDLINEKE